MSSQYSTGTRRRFLKTAGGTAAVGALAGCLGGGGGSGDSVTITHIGMGGNEQETYEEMLEKWGETRDEDITVQGQTVTNNIEILNAVNENPDQYDISSVMAINGVVLHELQYDGELFTEIDLDQIPNYTENVQEQWRSAENNPVMRDNPWSAFHFPNSQACAYNADEVEFTPTSWDDMKREELSGQVSHFDAGLTRYVQSAAAIEVSPSEGLQDDTLYQEIWDEARRQDEFVETYWASADEQVRTYREGSAVIGEAWGGQIFTLQQDGINMRHWIPEEGVFPGGATWMIVDGENAERMHDFLNFYYRRENAIEASENAFVPVPINDPPEGVTQLPDYIEGPELLLDIDIRTVIPAAQQLGQTWAEIKA